MFSYKGKLKYLAMASSERIDNKGDESNEYPQYFCIDVETITPAKGSLKDLEAILHKTKDGGVGAKRNKKRHET